MDKIKFVSQMSKEEILEKLRIFCFWDSNENLEPYKDFLMNRNDNLSEEQKTMLYYKILNGFNLHTIVKLIPPEYLKDAFDDKVLVRLFPKDLSKNYKYVRSILF
ncbi:MAG: hypothetical protein SFY32_07590 [Bacteroidota bacterium]|nr:hypothetical protein [Bacteroidota bacterium]